jgi:hypothetical protein
MRALGDFVLVLVESVGAAAQKSSARFAGRSRVSLKRFGGEFGSGVRLGFRCGMIGGFERLAGLGVDGVESAAAGGAAVRAEEGSSDEGGRHDGLLRVCKSASQRVSQKLA